MDNRVERPIIFSAQTVKAILENRKTQTRRIVKPQPEERLWKIWERFPHQSGCPYGEPGQFLWVRESFAIEHDVDGEAPPYKDGRPLLRNPIYDEGQGWEWQQAHYAATDPIPDLMCEHKGCQGQPCRNPWRPSMFMPRWASRITLEITEVRVERVWEISMVDCYAEGIPPIPCLDDHITPETLTGIARRAFAELLWDPINEERGFGWNANPWVWRLAFRRVERVERAG